ncbi:MAG: EAL domain-containing protein [Gammaproteobacteria bacterium]|nr:EAL domain-containing protein [Gammaproteobacteria bacterium]
MSVGIKTKWKSYWLFLIAIMLILLVPITLVLNKIYDRDLTNSRETTKQELNLLSHLSHNLLQEGEYDQIPPLMEQWLLAYPNTHIISLKSLNNYLISEVKQGNAPEKSIKNSKVIKYGYHGEAKLTLTKSIDSLYQYFYELFYYALGIWLFTGVITTYIIYSLVKNRKENNRLEELGSQLFKTNQQLIRDQSLLKSLIDSIPDLIFIKDFNSSYMGCNKAFEKFSKYTEAELIGKTDKEFVHSELSIDNVNSDKTIINSGKAQRHEEWITYTDGSKVLLDTLRTPYYDNQGQVLGLISISRDITEIKVYQEQLESMAFLDPLTNLPNRRNLIDKINSAIEHADRKSNMFGICSLDLDGFKEVNDNYGHDIGDQVLIEFASRLKNSLRAVDTVSRWGGDEFSIIYTDIEDVEQCVNFIERLLEISLLPIVINNRNFFLSASIGLTIYPNDNSDADTLLRHADQAMYDAKIAGKNRYEFFDHEQNKILHEHHEKRNRIEQAIQDNEMVLYFQPQIHLKKGAPYGVEALIRWDHPEDGILPPIQFLPYIENHHINIDLDWWVIEQALSQLQKWSKHNIYIHMSINVTSITFQNDHFVDKLQNLFNKYSHVVPEMISFELLETTALDNLEQVSLKMKQCQNMGVQFSLDDFGTGYSSLSYVSKLPVNVLKIDQSFIRNMLNDKGDESIVEGVIKLAAVFEHYVVAEGVETIEHGIKLMEMGCHFAQGYAIAKPLPADELAKWLSFYRAPKEWCEFSPQKQSIGNSVKKNVVLFSKQG